MHSAERHTQAVVPREPFEAEQRTVRCQARDRERGDLPARREIGEPEIGDIAARANDRQTEAIGFIRERGTVVRSDVTDNATRTVRGRSRNIGIDGGSCGILNRKCDRDDRCRDPGLNELTSTACSAARRAPVSSTAAISSDT